MPFSIIRNDITKVRADAIVNTANPKPVIGSGTDSAIYEAAGKEKLLAEREKIGNIEVGKAVVTPAFNLDAKFIIHTVGPTWNGGNAGEFDLLRSCYKESLNLAKRLGCESIAFPMISTGVYNFPKDEALKIATSSCYDFLMENDMDISLVVFDKSAFMVSGKLFSGIKAYIDENYVETANRKEYSDSSYANRRRAMDTFMNSLPGVFAEKKEEMHPCPESDEVPEYSAPPMPCASAPPAVKASIAKAPIKKHKGNIKDEVKDLFSKKRKEPTFSDHLLKLIDERNLKNSEAYNISNVSKQTFSKIISIPDYKPTKNTVCAFAIGLKLNEEEANNLLKKAGYVFTDYSKFDMIVQYCIRNHEYNIMEINSILFDYGLETLGQKY